MAWGISLVFNEWTNSKPKCIYEYNFSSHKNKKLFPHPKRVFAPITKQQVVDLIICYGSGKNQEFNSTPGEIKDIPRSQVGAEPCSRRGSGKLDRTG